MRQPRVRSRTPALRSGRPRQPQRQSVDEQPDTRSAPAPPVIRPNSTVPNTTSSRPVCGPTPAPRPDGTGWPRHAQPRACRAQPSCELGLHRQPRLCEYGRRPARPAGRRAPSARRYRRACRGRTLRAPPALIPRRACGDEVRNGSRRRKRALPSREMRLHLGDDGVQRSVVNHQVMDQQHQQPAAAGCVSATNDAQQRRLADVDAGSAARSKRRHIAGRSVLASDAISSSASSSTSIAARRQTTCAGSGSPSHRIAVRRMSWRSITDCSAARNRSSRSRPSKASKAGHQIGVALPGHQVMEQHALPAAAPAGRCPAYCAAPAGHSWL